MLGIIKQFIETLENLNVWNRSPNINTARVYSHPEKVQITTQAIFTIFLCGLEEASFIFGETVHLPHSFSTNQSKGTPISS